MVDKPFLKIDTNLIENIIRPLALGRKNYLFAGNNEAAQNIAMMYSFFATSNAKGIDPSLWLENILHQIADPDATLNDHIPYNLSKYCLNLQMYLVGCLPSRDAYE